MDAGEERIGLNGTAAVLGCTAEDVHHYVSEGHLSPEGEEGSYSFRLSEVEGLARDLGSEEIFEGEVLGEETTAGSDNLPTVPFERYERLLQQGQDYKTRLEERSRQMDEIRSERDAARIEIDRLWSEIERLNLVEYQRELQEKTISTLEEEKSKLEGEREQLREERDKLQEEKSALSEERTRLEYELKAAKERRGFWARLFGGE